MITIETAEAADLGAPVGPGEAEESAFLAEQRLANPPPPIAAIGAIEADEENVALPPMDDLIRRIPASAREVMDQLFRAKFIAVKRMPAPAFKTQI